jgi:hypothetical protein
MLLRIINNTHNKLSDRYRSVLYYHSILCRTVQVSGGTSLRTVEYVVIGVGVTEGTMHEIRVGHF